MSSNPSSADVFAEKVAGCPSHLPSYQLVLQCLPDCESGWVEGGSGGFVLVVLRMSGDTTRCLTRIQTITLTRPAILHT